MVTAEELRNLQENAAVATLTDRAFLRITGPDATRWLNGMVTNSIQALQPGEGCYNFLLNAQGRIQGDCHIYREQGEPVTYLLATTGAQIETIHTLLDKYIIMDDVELAPAFTDEASLLILGPQAPAALQTIALPALDPLRLALLDTPHGPVLALTTETPHQCELRSSVSTLAALQQQLALPEASAEALEALRIVEGHPRYGTDIRDKDLPQETNQPQALHFNKGCYLGQEIVERIRSRGQVHRVFTKFSLEGTTPALPAPLESNGKPAGELTSAAQVGDKIYALGYARREFLETNAPLTYTNGIATKRE